MILELEIKDFKSYKGIHKVGPFKGFTCVIGPNGSGKSNVMEAIIFVLGHKASQIRSSNLSELVYIGVEGKPDTYVKLNFLHKETNRLYIFQRKIIGNGSQYYIDDKAVSFEEYQNDLQSLGINIASRNFFVFQGDVENIATQNPKQITQMIENVSGSIQYKQQYERLKIEKQKSEDDVQAGNAKRKTISFEKDQFREQWKEVKEYQELQDRLDGLKRDRQLTKLMYQMNLHNQELETLEGLKAELEESENTYGPTESTYKQLCKTSATLHKEIIGLEDQKEKLERKKKKQDPESFKVEEEIKYSTDKINKTRIILEKAQKNHQRQTMEIQQLKNELQESMKTLDEAEKHINEDSGAIKMDSDQMNQYNELKLQAGKETSSLKIQLDQLVREQKIDMESLQTNSTKLDDLNRVLEQLKESDKKYTERRDGEKEILDEIQKHLKEAEKEFEELNVSFKEINNRQSTLNNDLEKIQYVLSDLKTSKNESIRDTKFNQTVQTLKSIFSGVFGKLSELVEPAQKKHAIALSVTLGKLFDAIVVDTEKTLLSCVQYLKEQRLGVATFLALDRMQTIKPINMKLRNLPESGTARLLYDAVKIKKGMELPVLYALGNMVVCDTLTEAKMLAYGPDRIKVITVNGIRISKSGLITGGGMSSFASKASTWDDKRVKDLKKQRDEILQELSDVAHINEIFTRKQQVASQVNELRSNENLYKTTFNALNERVKRNREEIETNKKEIAKTEPLIKNLTTITDNRKAEIVNIQNDIISAEDHIFKDFSRQFGIENIREFEEMRLTKLQENIQKRLAISQNISLLQSRIDYEEGRDIGSEIQQLNKEIESNERLLEKDLESKKTNQEWVSEFEKEYNQIKKDYESKKLELNSVNDKVKTQKKLVADCKSKIEDTKKLVTRSEFNLVKLKGEYHNILLETRNEAIRLPITQYDDVQVTELQPSKKTGKTDDEDSESERSRSESESESGKGRKGGKKKKGSKKSSDDESSDSKSVKKKKTTGKRKKSSSMKSGGETDDEDLLKEGDIELSDKPNLLDTIIQDITSTTTEEEMEEIYARELSIKFYTESIKKKTFADEKTYNGTIKKFNYDIDVLMKEMTKVMPNYKAFQHLKESAVQLERVANELDEFQTKSKEISEQFVKIRNLRKTLFMKAFKKIQKNLKIIYSELTRELEAPFNRGSAQLSLENINEPYDGSIKFTCIPPNKRFQEMDQLSGGEKSVAALAFLFSLQGFKSTPFLILDEIDAAFDTINVLKLVRYVKHKANTNLQFVVISLKELFYIHCDALVGVCRERDSTSKTFTLALYEIPESKEATKYLIDKGQDEIDEEERRQSSTSGGSSSSSSDSYSEEEEEEESDINTKKKSSAKKK
eukprot:gene2140-2638_t